jgi:hypothetical protein
LAIVDAEMSISRSAPLWSRSGDSGALVSENGTDAASLIRARSSVTAMRELCDIELLKRKGHRGIDYRKTRRGL